MNKVIICRGIPHESIDVQSVQGEDIVSKYEIKTVPTLILVDDEGNVVKKIFKN